MRTGRAVETARIPAHQSAKLALVGPQPAIPKRGTLTRNTPFVLAPLTRSAYRAPGQATEPSAI